MSANILLTEEFQLSVFSPVSVVSSTSHLSRSQTVQVFPKARDIFDKKKYWDREIIDSKKEIGEASCFVLNKKQRTK